MEKSYLKSPLGTLRDSNLQGPQVCSTVAGGTWDGSFHLGRLASPDVPHTIYTVHTLFLPVSSKCWPIPKHGLPPATGIAQLDKEKELFLLCSPWEEETSAFESKKDPREQDPSLPFCWPPKQWRLCLPWKKLTQTAAQDSSFQSHCPGVPFQRCDSDPNIIMIIRFFKVCWPFQRSQTKPFSSVWLLR